MEKIFVTIRVRPLSKVEAAKGSPWKLGPNSISLCNSTGAAVSGQSYTFDRVFDAESSTLQIYEAHTQDIIASAVQGFNGTVFAYGQTSSGKTYTMRGSPQEPGIIPLAVQEVFRNIEEAEDREFLLRVSYMEIYNEEINDLLAPENRKLQVHENLERGIFVAGLREEIVVSPEQVLDLMTVGETYRHVGETNMNLYSSRSHTIFRMVIESRDRSQDDPSGPGTVQSCDAVRVSVLPILEDSKVCREVTFRNLKHLKNLVDLAGSERVAKTGAEGARLKEGTHINKSLMTLGTVINKLSEGVEKQGGHVPYRDSKLTRILQPALGGNAKTAVICNITPAQVHVDETKGTLFFASRANRVTNCAQVNEIMTDAALLKRQKKEIEELRSKLQDNHSEHWEEEVLNLRNALLKIELERECMALALQEEKKAQAERERRLKEQEQKIENLSTMVINSAVDDRDFDRRNKKNNRRETWCPRVPPAGSDMELKENTRPSVKESPGGPFTKSVLPRRRDRLPPMPPPFESLMEEEGMVSPLAELDENTAEENFHRISTVTKLDSIFKEPPLAQYTERKRRSAEKSTDVDLNQQLGDLQVQYDELQFEHKLKMRDIMLEMEELKKEVACAQLAANKARKLEDTCHQGSEDRRGKSLDGWELETTVKQLRAQVQNLELEKFYMQKELNSVIEHAASQATSANAELENLEQQLKEARKGAQDTKLELCQALSQIDQMQKEKQLDLDQQAQLFTSFNELKLEVEATKSSSQAYHLGAVDSAHALKSDIKNLQESVVDVKALKAVLQNNHLSSLQSDLAALTKEYNLLLNILQTVQNERDSFCEISNLAQADLKSFEEEMGRKTKELQATEENLHSAKIKIVNAGNEVADLQLLLSEREKEQQVLEQRIKDLEGEALAEMSESEKDKLKERIAELEEELKIVAEERAILICKGDAMHATIQVLEGERDALIETSKQAQADMDRLQGKRRQELKDAQDKLEAALSETDVAKEQLIAMRAILSEKSEEQQILQEKLHILQAESTSFRLALEGKVQALETDNLMTRNALDEEVRDFESSRLEYEQEKSALELKLENLLACVETLNKEKCKLSENLEMSQVESKRLQRDLDCQIRDLELLRAQNVKDEKQLNELQQALSQQLDEVQVYKRKVVDLQAEKSAMETCLAGETPESISNVLVERSLQLSAAQLLLQSKATELENVKRDCDLLQETKATLEAEVAEAKAYAAAVEETLTEAVGELEASSQEKTSLKMELEKVLEESSLKTSRLVDLESECSALVGRLASMKVAMDEESARRDQEVQSHRASYEVAIQEKLELIEECKALRAALISVEEERETLKEQNFQAQVELKEFDVEVQRHREEIKVAEKALKVANDENMRAGDVILEHQALLSEKINEISFLQNKIQDMERKMSSLMEDLRSQEAQYTGLREDIDSKVVEMEQLVLITTAERALLVEKNEAAVAALQKVEEERDNLLLNIEEVKNEVKQLSESLGFQEIQCEEAKAKLEIAENHIHEFQLLLEKRTSEKEQMEQERDRLVQKLMVAETLQKELEGKIRAEEAVMPKLEAVTLEALSAKELLKQAQVLLSERTKEVEKLKTEESSLLDCKMQMQDTIESLNKELQNHQLQLQEVEGKLETAKCEVDDASKQLNGVHTLLTEKHQEHLMLQRKLEELETSKCALEKALINREAELTSKSEALSELASKLEASQHLHNSESSQFKSDILGLRKELKGAKAAPASLEKERDGLRKDLEKLKNKMGDVEAKLKSTLIEKSKVETEKVNIEREVKQLRQSTALLNKRESIVDKRRESVACGLNKTKIQLSSAEHALQMKTNELEKTAFDLQLLQDNYAKLEADMCETEKASVNLKEKLDEAETAISLLRDEKATAACSNEKIAQDLEDALEQRTLINTQLETLRAEHDALMDKCQICQHAFAEADSLAKSTALERDDLAQQLTDSHCEFDVERAAWASQANEYDARIQDLGQEIVSLSDRLQQVQRGQEEAVAARDAVQDQLIQLKQSLQESVEECVRCQEQIQELNLSVQKQSEKYQHLEDEVAADKEQYCALEENYQKLEKLLVVSESSRNEESQAKADLVEETEQLKEMLQVVRQNCKDLEEQILVSKAMIKEETNAKMTLLEDRQNLAKIIECHEERCRMLEEQIFNAESIINDERESKLKLADEVHQLKESLQQSMTDFCQQEAFNVNQQRLQDHILQLEANLCNERELNSAAKKEVEKLQSQLNWTPIELESRQAELDKTLTKLKSLGSEVDEIHASLDKARQEKTMLRQQIGELQARISNLQNVNEELQLRESCQVKDNMDNLVSICKLQKALDVTKGWLQLYKSRRDKAEELIVILNDENKSVKAMVAGFKKEADELRVELENLRYRCKRYEQDITQLKSTRTSTAEQERGLAEVTQLNNVLQLRLQNAEESDQARCEELRKMRLILRGKEEAVFKLEAALEKVQQKVVKLERELNAKNEPQTAQKPEGSKVFRRESIKLEDRVMKAEPQTTLRPGGPMLDVGELMTPVAFRQGDDDWKDTDDTVSLYSGNLASRTKWEQLKLQNQSLLQKYKQPWRIQRSPGGSMGQLDAYEDQPPPPSATLYSQQENLTAPIYTWKKATTTGGVSNSEFPQHSGSGLSIDNPKASLKSRSAQRAALAPVNRLSTDRLDRRLQAKLPMQEADLTEGKASTTGLWTPHEFRFSQPFEKENL